MGHLLDIGCGDGAFLLTARSRGFEVTGTELNPLAARNAGLTVFESLEDAATRGPFDVITLWHSLEHMKDARTTLHALVRHLAPGGVVVIAVPHARSWSARLFGRNWMHLDVPRHVWHFDDRALGAELNGLGLTIDATWNHEVEYDILGWAQSAMNAILPPRNEFYRWLTGKPSKTNVALRAVHAVVGAMALVVTLPFVLAEMWVGGGGTVVVAGSRRLK